MSKDYVQALADYVPGVPQPEKQWPGRESTGAGKPEELPLWWKRPQTKEEADEMGMMLWEEMVKNRNLMGADGEKLVLRNARILTAMKNVREALPAAKDGGIVEKLRKIEERIDGLVAVIAGKDAEITRLTGKAK